ncbi:MAG: hypothetical protein MZV64_43420 [Ignavibacteriales bacterium]|nr:hypothetical protein [Ignavibacteriales bacterium]
MRHDGLPARPRPCARRGAWRTDAPGGTSSDEVVRVDDHGAEAALGRQERDDAEVEAAGRAPRRRCGGRGRAGRRRGRPGSARGSAAMSGSRLWTVPSLAPTSTRPRWRSAQLADRRLGLVGEAHEALGVVLEHAAGLGEAAVLASSGPPAARPARPRGGGGPGSPRTGCGAGGARPSRSSARRRRPGRPRVPAMFID